MDTINPHEDDVFYDRYGMKQWERRHSKVTEILEGFSVTKVCDLGCSDGKLIRRLTRDERYELIIGVDVCEKSLEAAVSNAEPECYHLMLPTEREKGLQIKIFNANLLKDCSFLCNYNLQAITLVEVLEHIYKDEVPNLVQNIFGIISPSLVIVTTPNYEFNVWFHPNLQNNWPFRHDDHKFEMTRKEFEDWALTMANDYGYHVSFDGVGLPKSGNSEHGMCSQFAIFVKVKDQDNLNSELYKEFTLVTCRPLQTPILRYEVEYPKKKKKDLLTQFREELNYSYNFLRAYGDNGSNFVNWEDLTQNDFEFIEIEELLGFGKLSTLVQKDKERFFSLLNLCNLELEGIQLDANGMKLRCVPPEILNRPLIEEN